MTRFTISRASVWDDSVYPHVSAMRGKMSSHSYYTFRSVAEANKRYPDYDFEKVDGSVRSVGRQVDEWFVDFGSLDELMAFVSDVGDIVVGVHPGNHKQPHITIYDTYLE